MKLRDKRGIMERAARIAVVVAPTFITKRTCVQVLVLTEEATARIDATVISTCLQARENSKAPPGNKFARDVEWLTRAMAEVVVCLAREVRTKT